MRMGRTSDARERLMTAALDLVWEESYGAVTIDNICERAGVKKGSFYYFYKSKAELAVAALERMWNDEWKPTLDHYFSASVEPLARIQGFLEQLHLKQVERFKKYGKVFGCPAASVGSEVSTQEQSVCAKVRELMSRKMRYIESAIRDGIADGSIDKGDPAEKARNLGFLIEGAVSQARIMNDPNLLKNLPVSAVDMLRARALSAVN